MTTITDVPQTEKRLLQGARRQRVLVATDGGLAGTAAVRWLAERAGTMPLDVVVAEVLDPALPSDSGSSPATDAGITADHARNLLMQLAPQTPVRAEVLEGQPIAMLQQRSAEVDLVVVGTNRVSRSTPHLRHSFATRLASGCNSPLVVVPRGWEPSAGPIVVGVEGDGSDEEALAFAATEAETTGRELVIVVAWRLIAMTVPGGRDELRGGSVKADATARLQQAVGRVHDRHPSVQVAPLLGHKDAVHLLVRAGQGSSLVVVGRHRFLPRSVSEQLLEHPTCPMAVVPAVSE